MLIEQNVRDKEFDKFDFDSVRQDFVCDLKKKIRQRSDLHLRAPLAGE